MSLDVVLATLGAPEDISHNRLAYKYQGVPIHFWQHKADFIGLYLRGGMLAAPARLALDVPPTEVYTRASIERLMATHAIPYCQHPLLTFGDQTGLETACGVQIVCGVGSCLVDSMQYRSTAAGR
ncbi:hypothetical protein F8S13_15135 [Chloroflexia bacterium SDU3-3]|nr:hypothetical protein F8S13_15135 [Chloroflexia bacterium SDU3-3]